MKQEAEFKKLLDEIEYLLERYSKTRRATTQPFQLQAARDHLSDYQYRPDDELVRETLLEHVGSLPVSAIAFYPHIDDSEVDLGYTLTMLAIHDIGELITGDEITFTKKKDTYNAEYEAAVSILHPMYHDTYDDAETKTSKSAKFAKTIDKITPDIIDYLTPAEITKQRYKHFTGTKTVDEIIELIVKYKRPYMLWNQFMTEFHEYLMAQLRKKLEH